jgi:hypothetical protein
VSGDDVGRIEREGTGFEEYTRVVCEGAGCAGIRPDALGFRVRAASHIKKQIAARTKIIPAPESWEEVLSASVAPLVLASLAGAGTGAAGWNGGA